MRALLDASILVSYLLARETSILVEIVEAAVAERRYDLLLPEDLVDELAARVAGKPYLAERIAADDVRDLLSLLASVAEVLPRISGPLPAVMRDPKDDYLIAHALFGRADLLVTGDRDLLAIGRVGDLSIVTPRRFWEILREGGASAPPSAAPEP